MEEKRMTKMVGYGQQGAWCYIYIYIYMYMYIGFFQCRILTNVNISNIHVIL